MSVTRKANDMKIRTGFVSNSSSSSFMLAAAKVTDLEKATEFLKKLNFGKYEDVQIVCTLAERAPHYACIRGEDFVVESFTGDSVSASIENTSHILLAYLCPNEGDYSFLCGDPDNPDLDYGIGLDFFPQNMQDFYMGLTSENGFTAVKKMYGAGRNG